MISKHLTITFLHSSIMNYCEYIWVAILAISILSLHICWRLVKAYLTSKAPGQQTTVDQAHLFFYRSTNIYINSYFLATCLYRFYGQPESVLLKSVDFLHGWSAYMWFWSMVVDSAIQFLVAVKSNNTDDLIHDEETIFKRIKLVSRLGILLVLFLTPALVADPSRTRGPLYFIHMNLSEPVHSDLFLSRQLFIFVCSMISIVFRIILKIKFNLKEVSSNQIFSDTAFWQVFPVHFVMVILRDNAHNVLKSYVYDIHNIFAIGFLFLATTFCHKDLRKFAQRKIQNWFDLDGWFSGFFARVHFCMNLLFCPINTNQSD